MPAITGLRRIEITQSVGEVLRIAPASFLLMMAATDELRLGRSLECLIVRE
jgi:hypothetical protein